MHCSPVGVDGIMCRLPLGVFSCCVWLQQTVIYHVQCSPVGVDSLEYSLVACGSNKLSFTMCNVLLLELIAWSILLLRVGAINCHLPCAMFSCWS